MATINVTTIPFLVVAADTNDNVLALPVALNKTLGNPVRTLYIEVIAGSFQFAVGAVVTAANPTYTDGDKVIISCSDDLPLHFKAGVAAQSFSFSI